MADSRNKALFGGFTRLRNFPLDSTSVFNTTAELENYLKNDKTAYAGQVVYNLETDSVHVVSYDEERALSVKYITTATEIKDMDTTINNINGEIEKLRESFKDLSSNEDIQKMIDALRSEILGGDLSAELDSIKEIVTVIQAHQKEFEELDKLVESNKEMVNTLEQNVSKTYVKIDELDARVSQQIKEIVGIDDTTPDLINSIKEISEWIDKNKDVLSGLKAVAEDVRILDEKIQIIESNYIDRVTFESKVSEIELKQQELENSLSDKIDALDVYTTTQVDEKISDLDKKVSGQIEKLNSDISSVLEKEYITKEGLAEELSKIELNIENVEEVLVIPFSWIDENSVYARSDVILPKGTIIKSAEIEFFEPNGEIEIIYENPKDLVIVQNCSKEGTEIGNGKTIVTDDQLDYEVIRDELPETFIILGINHVITNEYGAKVRVEVDNFKNVAGRAFIKYLKPTLQ